MSWFCSYLIAQAATQSSPETLLWGALTGSGGTIVALSIAIRALWTDNRELRSDLTSLTKESIEVITTILVREEQRESVTKEVRSSIEHILRHVKEGGASFEQWKQEVLEKLDLLQSRQSQ